MDALPWQIWRWVDGDWHPDGRWFGSEDDAREYALSDLVAYSMLHPALEPDGYTELPPFAVMPMGEKPAPMPAAWGPIEI